MNAWRAAFPGVIGAICLIAVMVRSVCGQCEPQWLPGEGIPGVNGIVYAITTWDPDGRGPQPPLLVVGGSFSMAGETAANNIAAWDGTAWQPFGSGMSCQCCEFCDPSVAALTVFNNELIAGGYFNTAGGSPANRIARWNGTAWQPLGSGVTAPVTALTVFNDELIAGGFFTSAGGVNANRIARWNGAVWQSLGSGMNHHVFAVTAFQGELIAGGHFTTAGGSAANYIARWNGAAWQPLGNGMDDWVLSLTTFDNQLIAGGFFTTFGGSAGNFIAYWNGTAWQPLGSGMNGEPWALTVFNNELIAGGSFQLAGGSAASNIARWNATNWQPLGSGIGAGGVFAVTAFNDQLIAGGLFANAGGLLANNIANWGCVPVEIAASNPPMTSPYVPGVFRDVLQNTTAALVPQGIGVAGTPSEGPYNYAATSVTFSGTPSPMPNVANVTRECTDIAGNGQGDCPDVTSVTGSGVGPYMITLSAPPPPRECIAFTFAGTYPGQKLEYQVLPGDTNLDGNVSTQDLLWLVQRINDGTANLPGNRARYNINRSNEAGGVVVNTQDLLRLVQLLNGTNATQAFNGSTVAGCP